MAKARTIPPRTFTRAEDEMIVAQPHSGMSARELQKRLKCGGAVLRKRAGELGIVLAIKPKQKSDRQKEPRHRRKYYPLDDATGGIGNPYHVGLLDPKRADPLLRRLQEEHGP